MNEFIQFILNNIKDAFLLAFFAIVILGVYGPGYAASDFIYGQF